MKSTFILGVLVICCLNVSAAAEDIYVDAADGFDFWDGRAPAWDGVHGPKQTIQAGIAAAGSGDAVIVAQGSYVGSNNRDLDFMGKEITLRSSDPANMAVVLATVIDCEQQDRAFRFRHDETPNTVIDGLHITNGRTTESYPDNRGGAIRCDGAAPTIRRCIIDNCTAYQGRGGGIAECHGPISDCYVAGNSAFYGGGLFDCDGDITGCTISDNSATAYYGGGLWVCDGTITGCMISGNDAVENGGGLNNCDGIIMDCTITSNTTDQSGGGLAGCDGEITHCTITYNQSPSGTGGGLYDCAGLVAESLIENNGAQSGGGLGDCGGTVANCIIRGNSATVSGGGGYNCDEFVNCMFLGNSDHAVFEAGRDPVVSYCLFLGNPDGDWYDADTPGTLTGAEAINDLGEANDNVDFDPGLEADGLHLRDDSLCINAGSPRGNYDGRTDIDGDYRVHYGRVDIGVDEFFTIDGDFEPDGDVDMDDLWRLARHWLDGCQGPDWCDNCDVDHSNRVDLADLGRLADNWLIDP